MADSPTTPPARELATSPSPDPGLSDRLSPIEARDNEMESGVETAQVSGASLGLFGIVGGLATILVAVFLPQLLIAISEIGKVPREFRPQAVNRESKREGSIENRKESTRSQPATTAGLPLATPATDNVRHAYYPSQPLSIPYEKQITEIVSHKMCGAAALSMVYRSFGKDWSQTDIWPDVKSSDRSGNFYARTQHLARDAVKRDFAAIIVKARDPWQLLQQCGRERIVAIVNHRLQRSTNAGHFSVLIGVEDDAVVIHDPFVGPERRLSKSEFLTLWQPRSGRGDIGGNILVALADSVPAEPVFHCRTCKQRIPSDYVCPRCDEKVSLAPACVLGCIADGCLDRTWKRIYCPHCDDGIREVPMSLPK